MSVPGSPMTAKLVIGVFLKEKQFLEPIAEKLCGHFGPVDLVTHWMPFDYTDYYVREMGGPLFRRMFSFKNLVEQEQLPDIKRMTNALETEFAHESGRRLNIDPGYMLPERFVLATGKNYAHRIYIGKGIYADLTLMYVNGAFQTLPWTYPDYADQTMLAHLARIRRIYMIDQKKVENDH